MRTEDMATGTCVRLVISSNVHLVDLVHEASEKMAILAGFDADDALNVGLAVREAVINAIVHGNKSSPDLKVNVTLTTNPQGLKAKIRDQGNGFEPGSVPDPTEAPNLLETSGRGLLLMAAFVDKVSHRHGPRGTEVTLTKHLAKKKG